MVVVVLVVLVLVVVELVVVVAVFSIGKALVTSINIMCASKLSEITANIPRVVMFLITDLHIAVHPAAVCSLIQPLQSRLHIMVGT